MTTHRTHLGLTLLALAAAATVTLLAEPSTGGSKSLQDDPTTIGPDQLTDKHVQKAIEAIVEELYARKEPGRFWDPEVWTYKDHGSESQGGGYTALAVLALLYAGESYQNPRLRDAIDYLAAFPMEGTYSRAVRAHVWAMLSNKFVPNLEADTQWLLEGFSDRANGWDYEQKPRTTRKDNSIRQYAILAVWEAAKRGIKIDSRYWRAFEDVFIDCQLEDGGWNYKADAAPPRGSMTAAGLTVLFITQDFLHASDAVRLTNRRGGGRHERAIDLGLQWMEQNFSPTFNPGRDADFYYYLYGVERVGLASGYKFFGSHDWFREGAAELVRRLCLWDPENQTMTVHKRIAGESRGGSVRAHHLCFALMFLSRGRAPVAVNKLRIDDWAWNNRPRDAANMTAWLRDTSETDMIWQIVDFSTEPGAWLDAPLLYLASNKALPWMENLDLSLDQVRSDAAKHRTNQMAGEAPLDTLPDSIPQFDELTKIKRYLDLGGTLLAVNEGQTLSFATSIEQAGALMYPHLQWRELPDDHPVFDIMPVRGRKPQVKALSNGARELILLCMNDLSEAFQARDDKRQTDFMTAGNMFFYASEMNRARARLAGDRTNVTIDQTELPQAPIVHAAYDGNWQCEPAALEVFSNDMVAQHGIAAPINNHPLATIDALDPRPALVVVTGVESHDFTEAEQAAIKRYVNTGGLILFETPGGLGDFTISAEQMAVKMFADASIRLLTRHPIITGRGIENGHELTRVQYRPFALEQFGSRELRPRLRSMSIAGEPRIFFSREDISHGLLDQPCWNIAGYTPSSARQLMANMLRYAMQRETAASTPD